MNQQLALSGNQLTPEMINQMVSILPLLPSELLDKEQNRRTAQQVKQLADDLKNQNRVVTEYIAKNEDDKYNMLQMFSGISEASEQQTKIIQNTLDKVSYVTADPDKYKTLSDIGTDFIPNLSGYQLGVLLSKLGIAKRYRKDNNGAWETVPYKETSISNPLAKAVPSVINNRQVVSYHWNVELLKKKLLQALGMTGRLNEFQALIGSKAVWNFINSL